MLTLSLHFLPSSLYIPDLPEPSCISAVGLLYHQFLHCLHTFSKQCIVRALSLSFDSSGFLQDKSRTVGHVVTGVHEHPKRA